MHQVIISAHSLVYVSRVCVCVFDHSDGSFKIQNHPLYMLMKIIHFPPENGSATDGCQQEQHNVDTSNKTTTKNEEKNWTNETNQSVKPPLQLKHFVMFCCCIFPLNHPTTTTPKNVWQQPLLLSSYIPLGFGYRESPPMPPCIRSSVLFLYQFISHTHTATHTPSHICPQLAGAEKPLRWKTLK